MEESLQLVKSLPEQLLENATKEQLDRAQYVDSRIAEIVSGVKKEFIECGLLVAEVEDNSLWAVLINPDTGEPYRSMPEWARHRLSYARATYMEARRVVREFPDIEVERLSEIPRCNFKHLRLLPESKRSKEEWIEAAKGPEAEFVDKVIAELPELHLEKRTRLVFPLYDSQRNLVDKALEEKLKELKLSEPEASKEDALEHICREWMEMERI